MMTERGTDTEAELPTVEINFKGREIHARHPSPEQLLVWQRTLDKLANANMADWNGAQVIASLRRLRMIVDSVLANPVDIDWIDDEMLAGRFTLNECVEMLMRVVQEFQKPTNRAARREKKFSESMPARRKAPSTTPKKAAS